MMNHAFVRIVQGLFAAALLFQGFEYLQKPKHIISDMPTLHRLGPNYKKIKDAKKAKAEKKDPTKAQAPELRLFPDLNEKKAKAAEPNGTTAKVAETPTSPAPVPVPAPEAEPAPDPPADGDYLVAALEAGLNPMGFEDVVGASESGFDLLIDARDKNLYEAGHIPGAISIPYEFATRKSINGLLKSVTEDYTKRTIVYCGDKFCPKAFNLTKQLTELGHGDVHVYADGFSDWAANGGTVKTAADTPDTPDSPPAGDPGDSTMPPKPTTDDGTANGEEPKATGDGSDTAPAVASPAVSPADVDSTLPRSSNKVVPAERIKTAFSGKNKLELAMFLMPWLFIGLGLFTLVLKVDAFTWWLRICLGGLFIYSGLQKMIDPSVFAQNIACYLMVPSQYVNMMAFVLPPLEVIAGVALIFTPYLRHAAAFLILAMLVMFIGATGMALWHGLEIDCGCGKTSKPLEWSKIAKNTIYALGCLALLFYVPRGKDELPPSSGRGRLA